MPSEDRPEANTDTQAEAMEDRLEEVEEHIDEARREAEAAGLVDDHERRWVDSGTVHRDMDDQSIAPPG